MEKVDQMFAEEERGGGIQVIARAVGILNALSAHPEGMSLGEIAHEVALPRSTVQRIVGALEAADMIRSEGAGGIGLGPGLLRLMSAAHADLVAVTRPRLQQLSNAVEETVVLSRPSKMYLLVEHRLIAERELLVMPRLGLTNIPLYGSSAGRALLALGSDEEARELIQSHAASLPNGSRPDTQKILEQLRGLREKGFAHDEGELMEGVTTAAIALDSLLGRFSVSLPVPTARFEKNRKKYLDELIECKKKLGSDIGVGIRQKD